MALAAAAVYLTKRFRFGWAAAVLCIALSLGIYQAYIGCAVGLFLFDCMLALFSGTPVKDVVKRGFGYIAVLLAGLALYRVLLAFFLWKSGAALYYSTDTSLMEYLWAVPHACRQLLSFLWKPSYLIEGLVLAQRAMFLLAGAAAFIYTAARDTARKSRWSLRALSALLAAATLLAMTLMSRGAYITLAQASFHPRTMSSFGVLIALVGVCLAGARRAYPAKLACLLLSWVFFVFAFIYGDALAENQRYTDFRVQSVVNDLKDLDREMEPGEEKLQVQLQGHMSRSPVLEYPRAHGNYKLLDRLVTRTFVTGVGWSDYYFFQYFGLADRLVVDREGDYRELNLPLLKDTAFHTIWGGDGHILIEIKS